MDTLPQRPLVKREHIWASELGKPFVDRYLKMYAIPYTNPPNARSMRKFISGHIWEWIISMVLTMTGILKAKQLRGEVQLPGLLKVSGKLDFIAGGEVDWEKAKREIANVRNLFAASVEDMPPFIMHSIDYILPQMEKMFGKNPLKEYVLEMKSCSSFISEKIEKTKQPNNQHDVLQALHYLLANKMDEAKLIYVCKDDNIMHEFDINIDKALLKIYRNDVKAMTECIQAANKKNPVKSRPPNEAEVIFEPGVYRFSKNWRVEYSSYLEMLYGYATPKVFQMKWVKTVASWNRTFKRCVKGDRMTDLNLKTIIEAEKVFPEWDKWVQIAKADGAFQTQEEDEE